MKQLRFSPVQIASLGLIFLVWYGASLFFPPAFFPRPLEVLQLTYQNFSTGNALYHLLFSLQRTFVGFLLAFLISVPIGLGMGFVKEIENSFGVWVLVGLTIPGMSWAFLGVMFFRLSEMAVYVPVALVVIPFLTLDIWKGTQSLDRDLLRMANVFQIPRHEVVRQIVLPHLIPHFLAGSRYGLGLAWKITATAEFLTRETGVGFQIKHAGSLFDLAGVFSWTLIFAVVLIVIEIGIFGAIDSWVTRWRRQVTF